jgi:tetratricopeptide (TPR) repeat protein
VLSASGEIEAARRHAEASLAKRPDNAAARLLAARLARIAGEFDRALSHVDHAIALGPQREAFVEKARTLEQAGLRPQARQAWGAILDVVPDHAEAAARLGRLAWEDREFALAAKFLERAAQKEPQASVWFDLGLARQDLRDYAGAAAAYRNAIAQTSDHVEATFNLGVVLQEAGDRDEAMRAYAQAYRLRPDSFGKIAMALTSASHGALWLDQAALRKKLES